MLSQANFQISLDDLEFISNEGESTFKKLYNQNILIIGATSFVGMWMTESLIYADVKYNLKIRIFLICRDKEKTEKRFGAHLKSGKIITIYKNLFDVDKEELKEVDQVVNLATVTDSISPDFQLIDNIRMFDKFWNLLPSRVKNVLFTSSGAVYGKNPSEIVFKKEIDSNLISNDYKNWGYGIGKLSCEYLGFEWSKSNNINFNVARLFSFSGAFLPLDSSYILGNFIGNVLKNEPIIIKNKGNVYRSYMYGADLSLWLWKILLNGNNTVYNVGSDQEITTLDLAKLVNDVSKSDLDIQFSDDCFQDSQSYLPNINKAKTELGLRINFNLETSILKMINFYKKKQK
jgi:nucleoside-diphosphate-sugar epimerase